MFVFCFRCKITRTGNSQQENDKIKKTILITTKMAVFLFQRASNRELFGVSVSETVAPPGRSIVLFCYAKGGALEGGAPSIALFSYLQSTPLSSSVTSIIV